MKREEGKGERRGREELTYQNSLSTNSAGRNRRKEGKSVTIFPFLVYLQYFKYI